MSDFVHLHVHSNYSFCRGASRIESLVDAALARGMRALALTDTNGLYGLVWFLQYAAERGLRPIVGAELRAGGRARRSAGAQPRRVCDAVPASSRAAISIRGST